ncbi:MAG TPA: serine/threonine-protein kinase [Ktedonobacteraceae bacterium]
MALVSLYCAVCGMANLPQSRVCARCATTLPVLSSYFSTGESEQKTHTSTGMIIPNTLLKQRYLIVERLGRGGMGAVYKAVDIELGNALRAVKEMNMTYLKPDDINNFSEAFKHEALLLATLQHHHLPRIYDHFHEHGRWYLVMDFIEGSNLEDYLRLKGGTLSLMEVLGIGMQLCVVLDYLHTHEPPIVFRDLKPSNVMRAKDGHLYLIDFGIARIFKSGQARDTNVFISYGYAAPEQYGLLQTTPQADIYSLGATLHQLISGADPGKMPLPWAFAPLRLSAAVRATGLGHLIMYMLDANPVKRPESATRVKQELQRIAQGRTPSGAPVTLEHPSIQGERAQSSQARAVRPLPALPAPPQALLNQQVLPGGQVVSNQQALASAQAVAGAQVGRGTPALGTMLCRYSGHSSHVLGLAWSPDGSRIVSASADHTARIWHAGSGQQLLAYQRHTFVVQTVAWSPDGLYIASAGDTNTVQIWNAITGEHVCSYQGHAGYVTMLAWSPDGSVLASAGSDRTIQIWQPMNGRRRLTYRGHSGSLSAFAWSPDGTAILSICRPQERNKRGEPIYRTALSVWDTSTGKDLGPSTPESLTLCTVSSVAWSPDGKYLALGGSDACVHVYHWEWGFKEEHCVFRDHTSHIRAVAWSPNGRRIASGSDDSCALVWDALTGTNVDIYRGTTPIHALAWAPDSQRLVASLDGRTAQVWQAD